MPITTDDRGQRRLDQMRAADRKRNERASAAAGEVLDRFGKRPPIANPRRRKKAHDSLRFWLTDSAYFPHSTGRAPFCREQEQMVERLQEVFTNGGKTAHAGFRGCAKSAIHELAVLWALATGRRRFLTWFGATSPIARAAAHAILIELAENDELAADWPDMTWLFHALEGEHQRSRNQKYKKERTYMVQRVSTCAFDGSCYPMSA
jgi:hypothetical protein